MSKPKRIVGNDAFRAYVRKLKGSRTFDEVGAQVGMSGAQMRMLVSAGSVIGPKTAERFGFELVKGKPTFIKREG